jgi:formylglycine-generating enzyme required for sulfatase activity/ribosomal protein L7/L12
METPNRGLVNKKHNDATTSQGINHLLAIGINDYVHCPSLNNAVKDIADFVALMHDKYDFSKEYTRHLYNEQATQDRILEEFKRLVKEVQPQDTVLIYFSGHGESDDILEEGFWIPVEAERGKENHYIRNSTIQKVLLKINSFHTFLIVDSCYSGTLFLDGKGKFVSDSYDFPSRWGLTSGRNTIVNDGKAGTNSPFAAALLDTLRRLDKPMNVSALCDIIKQTVPATTNKLQKPIGDPLSIEGHKGGQFIFKPKSLINPEEALWQSAVAQNTEGGYSQYLRHYRNGIYAEQAELALENIEKSKATAEEETFWQDTISKNTLLGYHRYLRKYPKGTYADEAEKRLDILENQQVISPISPANEPPILNPQSQSERVNVVLVNTGGNKLQALKIVKNHLLIGLKEAKDIIDSVPSSVYENVEKNDVLNMLKEFDEIGAVVRLEPYIEKQMNTQTKTELQSKNVKVILESTGGNNLQAIKIVKNQLELGLADTKNMIDTVPSVLYESVEKNSISAFLKELEAIGAKVRIEVCNPSIVDIPKPDIIIPKKFDFEPKMVFVKGGTFKMGSNDYENEKPVHDVTLSDFYIGKYPITQAQWQAVMDNNPSHFKGDNLPVENISWFDCQDFIYKLNDKTGKLYRLPIEAEWEFAAKGGNHSKAYTYAGSNSIDEVAWYEGNAMIQTHPIAIKNANELGIYDMSGNVCEWCQDWYDENYYKSSIKINPKGPEKGRYRVYRGGSWNSLDYNCGVANREMANPIVRKNDQGFRVVRND